MKPDPNKAKVAEMDQEIARLSEAVEKEKAETKDVVWDLRVKLRHNQMLNGAIKARIGSTADNLSVHSGG